MPAKKPETLPENPNDSSTFNPTFNAENWVASAPQFVKIEGDQLLIAAAPGGNFLLTRKSDFQHARVVVEVAAAQGTEAYVILNAQQEGGKWFGVTSKIHFDKGKIIAGGQRTGFRSDIGKQLQFGVGEHFKLRLRVHDGKVDSAVNGRNTASIAYGKGKTNETGSVGFVVKKGVLSVKACEVVSTKKN